LENGFVFFEKIDMLEKSENLSILMGVGIEHKKSPFMTPAGRVLQYHVISYITRGEGTFQNEDNVKTQVHPGTAIYQFPNLWHCFDPLPNTSWKEYWLIFNGSRATEFLGHLLPQKPIAFHTDVMQDVMETWEELYDIWGLRQPGYAEYSQFLLHKILIEFHRQRNRQVFFRTDNAINQLRQEMRSHLAEPEFDVADSSQARRLGYDLLRKRFKKSTGLAPKEYFLLLKINRAKELLLRPTLTVKEISQCLGFEDQYYFSRLFKHHVGISPKHYRQQLLNTAFQNRL
jgi:AraC-like DNA-binding protein